jgi:hypothetical protein
MLQQASLAETKPAGLPRAMQSDYNDTQHKKMQETAARMPAEKVMPAVTGMLASTERDALNSMPAATRMPV